MIRAWFAVGLVVALAGAANAQGLTELKIGDMAPNFTLQGTDGKTHRLSEYHGKQAVVLAWFPKAFTQPCTIEGTSLVANGDKIREYEVAYFMVSVDSLDGEGGNVAFAKSVNADFPFLSDSRKTTAKAYGVLNEQEGLANRWTFYIDKSGKIAAIDKTVRPATSAEDIIVKLGELQVPTRQRPGWAVTRSYSADRMMVVEVEAERPERAREIAVEIMESVQSLYEEVLIYVRELGASGEVTVRRVQWTPRDGYIETTIPPVTKTRSGRGRLLE